MSAGGGDKQNFDLNLAPIIDCFTVLITYLLVSASFISFSVLDVGLASQSDSNATPSNKPPPVSVNLTVINENSFEIKLTGGAQNLNLTLPLLNKNSLLTKIKEIKKQYPTEDLNISAQSQVSYRNLVTTIEELKRVFKMVYISG
jgi:biopolymer transport protein ExbD